MDGTLGPAYTTDAVAIADVHRRSRAACYGTSPDPDDNRKAMWATVLADSDWVTLVDRTLGQLRGFVSFTTGTTLSTLHALYVAPEQFALGVGSSLHQAFIERLGAGQAGVLEVWAGNSRAIEFYRQRGWAPTSATRPGPAGFDFVTYRMAAPAVRSGEAGLRPS